MTQASASVEKVVVNEKAFTLFLDKKFLLLWLTLLASSLSVSFFLFATNWYVVDYLGLEKMLGLVFFASSVPRLVFMLVGGVIADRMSKPWIMFISDVAKGVLLIGVIGLLFFDFLSIWTLIGLAFLFGILDAFFWPASGSIIPSLVKTEQLTRANSVLDMTRQASAMIGPLFAALLLGFGGYIGLFAFTAIFLLLAGGIDLLIKNKMNKDAKETHVNEPQPNVNQPKIFESIKEGFAYVKTSPFLLSLMTTTIFLNLLFTGPLTVGMPLFAKNVLNGTEVTYSYLYGALAAGMLIGSLLIGVLNIQKKRGLVSVSAIMALAIFFVLLSLSDVLAISLALVFLMGAAVAGANIPLVSVIQQHTESNYLGRVMSFVAFSSMGLVPISYLLTSLLISMNIPINTIMLLSSSLLSCFILFVLIKAKSLREVD